MQEKFKLNNLFLSLLFLLVLVSCNAQQNSVYYQKIAAHRQQLNEEFFNPSQSPLDSIAIKDFKGLKFYAVNQEYLVKANLTLNPLPQTFELPHSREKTRPYRIYGYAKFELNNTEYTLQVLEQVKKKQGFENYLIIPFTDLTNGHETYGGGRYIELEKPAGNILEIDFNLCFNPYCAWNSKYTCPIPPKENHLPVKIEAGMKYKSAH